MGVYAETAIVITCKNNKIAKEVKSKIIKKAKEDENDLNYQFYGKIVIDDNEVYVDKSSGRIQNLEYQCEKLWELIKDIKGVIEMNCPFLTESDGPFFTNNPDN